MRCRIKALRRRYSPEARLVTPLVDRNELAKKLDTGCAGTTAQWEEDAQPRERPDPPVAALFDDPEDY